MLLKVNSHCRSAKMTNQGDQEYRGDESDELGNAEPMVTRVVWSGHQPILAGAVELNEVAEVSQNIISALNQRPLYHLRAADSWTNVGEQVPTPTREEWPCAGTEPYVPIVGNSPDPTDIPGR